MRVEQARRFTIALAIGVFAALSGGCALFNGFLDPTAVGQFPSEVREVGIRRVLTPRDMPPGPPNAMEPLPEDLVLSYADYEIGPGDTVQIVIDDLVVRGLQDVAVQRVSDSGYIRLPVEEVGSVRVAGLTEAQAEQELRRRLREAGVLQRPVVRLTLQTRIGRYFNIRGSVVAPGRQPIPQPDLRLLDAIALAGDIGPEVRELYILRRQDQRAWRDADELIAPEDELPADENGLVIPPPMEENWSMGAAPGLIATASFLQEEEEAAETADDEAALEEVMSPGADADADDGDRPFDPIIFDPVTGEPIEAPPADEEEPTEPEDAAAVEELPVDDGETDEPFDWEDVPAYEDMHRVIRIDVRALKAGDPRYNVVIRNGDTINVPVDTGVFYMMGEVNQPGVYAFNGREITIKQAVGALARGFSALAWPSKCEIIRREPGTDRELIIPVNLDRIYAGLEPDILLQDEDIVNVGTDPISPFLFVIRNSFRFTYGFGFVYDRNFADIDSFSAQANPNDVRRQQRAQRGLPF